MLPFDTLHNNTLRGLLYVIIGSLLLLYTLDIMTVGVSIVLMICSILLIIYGFRVGGFHQTIQKIWNRFRTKKPTSIDVSKDNKKEDQPTREDR